MSKPDFETSRGVFPDLGKAARIAAVPVTILAAMGIDNLMAGRNIPQNLQAFLGSNFRSVRAGNMPSQELAPKESLEILQTPTNPITFTLQGKQHTWYFDNASFGIPPNDPNSYMGTIYVSIEQVYQQLFQLPRSWFTETLQGPGVLVGITGLVADTDLNKGYVMSFVSDNRPGYLHLKGVVIIDGLSTPGDWSKMTLTTNEGLDIETFGDPLRSFTEETDSNGKYLRAVVQRATDPNRNGPHRLRLDEAGNPVGVWVQEPLYRIYIPAAGKNSTY